MALHQGTTMRTSHHDLGLVALFAVLLGACSGTVAPPPSPSVDASGLPADPDELVVQLRSAGGFMAPEYTFRDLPSISVYADGRVIVDLAGRDVHAGSLLPSLVTDRLDPGEVEALLIAAERAGLASGNDVFYPSPGAADVPPTTFIIWSSAGATTTTFGALGVGPLPDDPGEIAARDKAIGFVRRLAEVAKAIGSDPYRPAVVRAAVRTYAVTDPAYVRDPVDWPLSSSLATAGTPISAGSPDLGRCVLVSGAELDRLWPILADADVTTPFTSDGERYALVVRPLLPDEAAVCP